MTKLQFENTKKPLFFICTIDPLTNKATVDYYDSELLGQWLDIANRDFPERFVFYKENKASINYQTSLITND